MLILYPATLLNSFLHSSSFCVESLGFLYIVSCPLHIMTVSQFPSNLDTLISCLIIVARTCNTMLSRSGENSIFFTDFRGKTFSFSLFSVILVVNLP